ncbi:MAG: FHIPEP family type III secretion protein, partial [Planctomycetota bacterium]
MPKKILDLALPLGIVLSILVIYLPLPTGLMDFLLAANLTVSVVLLLSALFARSPLELSVFPALLLVTTLSRLALNIATTRLILTNGPSQGDLAAGEVVRAFAQFVTGDQLLVGAIIFAILFIVQFVVITKGATRIGEVSARFALDGLPGRQMAIDADLNAGLIDHREAQTRRQDLLRAADFHGAMDGASKYVRGDAIAGLLITGINLAGGLFLGL